MPMLHLQYNSLLNKPGLKSFWLYYFVVYCQYGTLNKAAQYLKISSGSLERVLDQLEKHLGVQLLIKQSPFADLTPLGQQFMPEALKIISELQRIRSVLTHQPLNPSQSIRLGSSSDWMQQLLLPFFKILINQYPDKHICLEQFESQWDMEKALLEQRLDFVMDWREPRLQGIDYLAGTPNPYIVVASPKQKRTWDQWQYATPDVQQGLFKPWEHESYPLIQTPENHFSGLLELALSGLCALYGPECLVRKHLQNGTLVQICEPPVSHVLTPYLLWSEHQSDPNVKSCAETFIESAFP
jgi:DNA-binding transcriptional LysR family regulator